MIRITQIRLNLNETEDLLPEKICKKLKIRREDLLSYEIHKKSIDARKKDAIFTSYQIDVKIAGKESAVLKRLKPNEAMQITRPRYEIPDSGASVLKERPVIIGTGPAGLFCGYLLASAGYEPILVERGGPVEERDRIVRKFWEEGILDPECNVQFGEGGAGTFSDGKLNTLVKDPDGRGRAVLSIFVRFGADPAILYEQKPHIGTDVLKEILKNMRRAITDMGGTFYFHTKLEDLAISNGTVTKLILKKRIAETQEEMLELNADQVVLAIGHSARDTFQMLYEKQLKMHAKSFAVGVRIEHPQKMIQIAQYGETHADHFPPAPYKVTAKAEDGRGVYSFCMCPGGYVVNASSEPGMLAVNGMSNRARDGRNANSAMIVTVSPEDFGDGHPLSGVRFQRKLERAAYDLAGGKVPVSLYGDFKAMRLSGAFGDILPDIKGSYAFAPVHEIFPDALSLALISGITQCGKKIRGFDRYDAVLSGVESRTSSPVKMERNEQFESSITGLYPCGEGAGYAGGITSAAMDGMRIAEGLIRRFAPVNPLQNREKSDMI